MSQAQLLVPFQLSILKQFCYDTAFHCTIKSVMTHGQAVLVSQKVSIVTILKIELYKAILHERYDF